MLYFNDFIQNNIEIFGLIVMFIVVVILIFIIVWSRHVETRIEEGQKPILVEKILLWKLPWVSDNLPFTRVRLAGGVIVLGLFGLLVGVFALMGKLY